MCCCACLSLGGIWHDVKSKMCSRLLDVQYSESGGFLDVQVSSMGSRGRMLAGERGWKASGRKDLLLEFGGAWLGWRLNAATRCAVAIVGNSKRPKTTLWWCIASIGREGWHRRVRATCTSVADRHTRPCEVFRLATAITRFTTSVHRAERARVGLHRQEEGARRVARANCLVVHVVLMLWRAGAMR